jgi:RNA polymerase sigma-B factor
MSVTRNRDVTADRRRVERVLRRWHELRDPRDREQLVREFTPLARKLAARYVHVAEPLDDLIQVATIGLIKAIDRFDPERGAAFSSFAIPTILGELKRHFRDHCWSIHVPRGEQELALRVQNVANELTARTGHSPTVAELAQHLEVSTEAVVGALDVISNTHLKSLDALVATSEGDGSTTLGDLLGGDDDGYDGVVTRQSLNTAAAAMSEDDRRLLGLRFEDGLTQREIAERIGCSQMHVSRLLRRALARLREEYDAGPRQVTAA